MIFDEFVPTFHKLAKQLQFDADEDTIRSYFDALSDIQHETVFDAAGRLAKTAKWFPKTSEWRDSSLHIEQEKRRLDLTGGRTWKTECERCEDTGWEYFWCPGDKTCSRNKTHLSHSYVRECVCRPNNRTFQRHHQHG
jgi:hypothetical protein